MAQFKLGALIIEDTFNLSFGGSYQTALLIFSVTVIVYTAYGGFRAVVWTDVMQGIVMGLGVIILVPIVLAKTGGLEKATRELAVRPPTVVTSVPGPDGEKASYNDLVVEARGTTIPKGLVYRLPARMNAPLKVTWKQRGVQNDEDEGTQAGNEDLEDWIMVDVATDAEGRSTSTGNDVKAALETHTELGALLTIDFPYKNNAIELVDGQPIERGATGAIGFPDGVTSHRFVFVRGDELVFGPGRRTSGSPFHPFGMILSFFVMWAIVGMGQPGTMVRLIAFRESRTLKRAIITVTIYYGLIYLPLVFIVLAARSSLPVLNAEDSDRAIVLIATRLVADMGVGYQILGAIFVAAPFAAVMSTVDSFLLMISSGAVRDIYQRTIHPGVSDRAIQRASYAMTVIVGVLVAALALKPPDFLQRIIVFTSGGFAATFLCPTFLGIYWRRMTRQGALAGMVGGFAIVLGLFAPNLFGGSRLDLFGLHPNIWGLVGSLVLSVGVSLAAGPPPEHLVRKYFYAAPSNSQSSANEPE